MATNDHTSAVFQRNLRGLSPGAKNSRSMVVCRHRRRAPRLTIGALYLARWLVSAPGGISCAHEHHRAPSLVHQSHLNRICICIETIVGNELCSVVLMGSAAIAHL